jgi:hypothetical protein
MSVEDYRRFLEELSTEDLVARLRFATETQKSYLARRDRASWARHKSWEMEQLTCELARRQGTLDGL